jgi:Co/Zn/Cd efflux system component
MAADPMTPTFIAKEYQAVDRHPRSYRQNKDDKHRQHAELAVALSDGPRTLAEIEDYFGAYYRLFGMFAWQLRQSPQERAQRRDNLAQAMAELERRGWVQLDGDRYALTETGRGAADQLLQDMRQARSFLDRLQTPEMASKVSLAVYLVLSLIKLPAGLLSGSVGLINDSLDTLLDGLCSFLIFLGFRFHKERLVNIFQVAMLVVIGCISLYQGALGLFRPHAPDVDFFTFLAAVLSALACAGLYYYQRSVGLKCGSFGLITQSVDSRNHIFVAAGVTTGLVASLLRFGLLDALVGLAVAALILKSAIELGIELFRSLNSGNDQDLSQYRITMPRMERHRQDQLCDWMLFLVQQGKVQTEAQFLALAQNALMLNHNPLMQTLGLKETAPEEASLHLAFQHAANQGWMVIEPHLELTAAGKKHLSQQIRRGRRGKRHARAIYF